MGEPDLPGAAGDGNGGFLLNEHHGGEPVEGIDAVGERGVYGGEPEPVGDVGRVSAGRDRGGVIAELPDYL
jgi:hypothetical protein